MTGAATEDGSGQRAGIRISRDTAYDVCLQAWYIDRYDEGGDRLGVVRQRGQSGSKGRAHAFLPVDRLDHLDGLIDQLGHHLLRGGSNNDHNRDTPGLGENASRPDHPGDAFRVSCQCFRSTHPAPRPRCQHQSRDLHTSEGSHRFAAARTGVNFAS